MTEGERSFMAVTGLRYKRTHTLLLDLAGDMTDEELRWQPQPPGNSAAWILWHLGRFADGFQVEVAHAHEDLAARLGRAQEGVVRRASCGAVESGCHEARPDRSRHRHGIRGRACPESSP